jgi:hypothetical protein
MHSQAINNNMQPMKRDNACKGEIHIHAIEPTKQCYYQWNEDMQQMLHQPITIMQSLMVMYPQLIDEYNSHRSINTPIVDDEEFVLTRDSICSKVPEVKASMQMQRRQQHQ